MHDLDVEVPEGRIRDAVLLTHAARHARLEDMSFAEPTYWLRNHSYEADGKPVQRKAGDKVAIQGTLQQDPAAAVLSYDPVPVYGVLPVGPKMTAAMQVLDHKWARAGRHRACGS